MVEILSKKSNLIILGYFFCKMIDSRSVNKSMRIVCFSSLILLIKQTSQRNALKNNFMLRLKFPCLGWLSVNVSFTTNTRFF